MNFIPRVLFIDWHKTLSNNTFWQHLGSEQSDILKNIEEYLFVKNSHLLDPWMRGQIQIDDVLSGMAVYTNLTEDYLLSELKRSCEAMQFISDDYLEMIATIQKKGIRVVLATDNMDVFDRYTVPALNLKNVFDGIINSFNVGALKSDRVSGDVLPFFKSWLHDNNVNIHDAVLIDDSVQHQEHFERSGLKFLPVTQDISLKDCLRLFV